MTETFISLRKLENEALNFMRKGQADLFILDEAQSPIQVTIDQFYGIEINDFAVAVAKTALWIAESQMMKETSDIINQDLDFLPLTTNAYIAEGNALRMDWNDIIPANQVNYIMGNPPFIAHSKRSEEQKQEMNDIFLKNKRAGRLDYVCAWYKKSCDFMKGLDTISASYVSTSSICQGEHVSILWKSLFEEYDIKINFAYRSFKWTSESKKSAAVYCVIIGFSNKSKTENYLYTENCLKKVTNINAYLLPGENIFIESRISKPPLDKKTMTEGSKPWDGGYLILSKDEKDYFINKYPITSTFIKKFIGGEELLKNKQRYCFWLKDINPLIYKNIREIRDRLNNISKLRQNAKAVQTFAEYPFLFVQDRQPTTDYLALPKMNKDTRKYIPIEFIDKNTIASDLVLIVPNADMLTFGLLSSRIHMLWVETICGRLGNGMRYSPSLYYNFPTPSKGREIKDIILASEKIIQERKKIKMSLDDLYDGIYMPIELRKAHEMNDKAVMKAYGFKSTMSDDEIVAELMKLYQRKVKENEDI